MRKNKALGQHFLNDHNMARAIANSLEVATDRYLVLEIGPGEGVLTRELVDKGYDLRLVEFDNRWVAYLQEHFPAMKDRIIQADFLKMDLQELLKTDAYAIIGNFPYQISTGILFKILEDRERVTEMVGMFQREVAERVAAPPGSKVYGITSVLVQAYYEVEKLMKAPPEVFDPPPKVHSLVIRLTRRMEPLVQNSYEDLRKVVKAAFNKRRKTLRNALSDFGPNEHLAREIYSKRAEQLSIKEFDNVTTQLLKER